MPIIDSQVHTYEANTPARPWHDAPDWPAHVTGEEMVAALDAVGVDGAILVSPFTLYRYDASYALRVQRTYPGRFAVVKPVDPEDPAVEEVIADWKQTPGAVGVRVFLGDQDPHDPNDPRSRGLARVASAAARQELPVNVFCWGRLGAARALIERHPVTRFVIDHLGMVQPMAPPVPPSAWAELPEVLRLAECPNAMLKLSGVCTLARQPFPFADIWEPLARVFDAWGIERCLWGTDWTRATALVSYADAVRAFALNERLSESERSALLGGNCARTYGWAPRAR